ncbi:MAG: HAMP domain-containing protein [Candidatus Electrothrix sp. AR3]|nr:HAMP domain-containing protein [Candidatus Electrothrix sp. AR3]
MILFGASLVVLLSSGYDLLSHHIVIDRELNNIKNLSEEVAFHLDSHLKEKTKIALTLSSAPLIKAALVQSNAEFAQLEPKERAQELTHRNQHWQQTENINTPLIQAYLKNPVAEYLKEQQRILPKMYGEIFLTNAYGAMIASTGKLTTLVHAHKYWWKACFHDGQGRIFLDDRGFDTSVQGYVLGVVVPIKKGNEFIGLLKCNVNVLGPLTDVLQGFSQRHPSQMKITRTSGLIVKEQDKSPLSTKVHGAVIPFLQQKKNGASIISTQQANQLVAFAAVPTTLGSKKIGFGGSKASIDHIRGNQGEAWHVVISLEEEKSLEAAHETTWIIIFAGIIFTFLTAVVALFLGKLAAGPIVSLAGIAQSIGNGNLQARAEMGCTDDEIGSLAQSLNKMTKNLANITVSRDKLSQEIEHRKQVERQREELIEELQLALSEIQVLRGILPICAYCKSIRNDEGYYEQIEGYIHKRSGVDFSHTICPTCMKKHYPEEYKQPWPGKE